VAVAAGVAGCTSVPPEENAVREIMWAAATDCARDTGTITVTDIDSYGRLHYTLAQGGKQDLPRFEACYDRRLREELARRPDLREYIRKKYPPPTARASLAGG
jgi:hypothetical protein